MKGSRLDHLGSITTVVASSSSSSSSLPTSSQQLPTHASLWLPHSVASTSNSASSGGTTGTFTTKSSGNTGNTSKSNSLGTLRIPRLSWFQILCRWFPFFLICTTTTPLSLGMYKGGGGPGAASNILDNTLGYSSESSSSSSSQEDIINSVVSRNHDINGVSKSNHNAAESLNNNDKNNKMKIPGLTEEDQKFLDRVQSSLRTVQNWDASTDLLQECRTKIPWSDLNNATGPYSDAQQDRLLRDNANALFLQRLCRWFPKFMSWVNAPPCQVCGCTECEMKTVRGPETEEEKEGEAKRVEVYYCPQCKANTTTFPRYNKASKLLETRKGRCGEYSNLFGLVCRSVGFETRLVLDLSDHLWTEIRIDDNWIMADACEGIIDKASMYEHGWGKDGLCYMVAIGHDHVVDVSSRYTRKFMTEAFQTRRRNHTTSEESSDKMIHQLNLELQKKMDKARLEEVQRRKKLEDAELQHCKQRMDWTEQEKYGRGRISGSFAWKQSRQETGKQADQLASQQANADGENKNTAKLRQVAGFEVEAFMPPKEEGDKVTFQLYPNPSGRHDGIVVSNVPCAVGETNSISVVVVDEKLVGCILQSKSFVTWQHVIEFIDTLPSERLVLMNGKIQIGNETRPAEYREISINRLGGWKGKDVVEKGVLYLGQVDANPDWTFCGHMDDNSLIEGYEVELVPEVDEAGKLPLSLRTERGTLPPCVAARLPESFMPLSKQLKASDSAKRSAFVSFAEATAGRYCGYVSKVDCPIYLLDSTSYPLQQVDATTLEIMGRDNVWNTFLKLPYPLVPKDDDGLADVSEALPPAYNIPLNAEFFNASLGPILHTDVNTKKSTHDSLLNARLIGLYFSAHWCGPCRSFTPMLAEMYSHLKEEYPSHGLEIVFVSGDRDENSFRNYCQSMPWLSIPFDELQYVKQALNMTYGVRGIPSLVILDAVSGQVVVPAIQSRQEVSMACRGGDQAIESLFESWLSMVPVSTQELISILELSTHAASNQNESKDSNDNEYLKRPMMPENTKVNPLEARIKLQFEKLVEAGHEPNVAAATALKMIAESPNVMNPGPLDGKATYKGRPRSHDAVERAKAIAIDWNSSSAVQEVVATALKYLKNASKQPWEPKFRSFKLSNKIADSVTQVEGGWGLLRALGFEVVPTHQDYKANIPVSNDLTIMEENISTMMHDMKVTLK